MTRAEVENMSDEELSKAVAEILEPLSTIRWKRLNGEVTSFGGFWKAGRGWDEMPRNPASTPTRSINDPAVMVMLLEKLWRMRKCQAVSIHAFENNRVDVSKANGWIWLDRNHIQRSVAEAFILAFGESK